LNATHGKMRNERKECTQQTQLTQRPIRSYGQKRLYKLSLYVRQLWALRCTETSF